jgi:hypothetical protein
VFTAAQSVRLAQIEARIRFVSHTKGEYQRMSTAEQDRDDLYDLLQAAIAAHGEIRRQLDIALDELSDIPETLTQQ